MEVCRRFCVIYFCELMLCICDIMIDYLVLVLLNFIVWVLWEDVWEKLRWIIEKKKNIVLVRYFL